MKVFIEHLNKEVDITAKNVKELLDKLQIVIVGKRLRAGKGKLRGRKYKKNAGLLLVTGDKEKLKTNVIDVTNAKALNVTDLANGGAGRLTMYTEEAIKNLGERLK